MKPSNNVISVTVRIPSELNDKLKTASQCLGMTKTNVIRMAIHALPKLPASALDFGAASFGGEKYRMVLNINRNTYNVLEDIAEENHQPINAVVTASCVLALERATKWLQSI